MKTAQWLQLKHSRYTRRRLRHQYYFFFFHSFIRCIAILPARSPFHMIHPICALSFSLSLSILHFSTQIYWMKNRDNERMEKKSNVYLCVSMFKMYIGAINTCFMLENVPILTLWLWLLYYLLDFALCSWRENEKSSNLTYHITRVEQESNERQTYEKKIINERTKKVYWILRRLFTCNYISLVVIVDNMGFIDQLMLILFSLLLWRWKQ